MELGMADDSPSAQVAEDEVTARCKLLEFPSVFLEVRKCPLSQTMYRGPSDVSRVLRVWKKEEKSL